MKRNHTHMKGNASSAVASSQTRTIILPRETLAVKCLGTDEVDKHDPYHRHPTLFEFDAVTTARLGRVADVSHVPVAKLIGLAVESYVNQIEQDGKLTLALEQKPAARKRN